MPINPWTGKEITNKEIEEYSRNKQITDVKNLERRITRLENLLRAALPFVQDMVGVASSARGLPEEIEKELKG